MEKKMETTIIGYKGIIYLVSSDPRGVVAVLPWRVVGT